MTIPMQSAERLSMRMSDLVENVSKKPIPPYLKNVLVEVMVNDAEGEDVEVGLLCFFPFSIWPTKLTRRAVHFLFQVPFVVVYI
jgi:hypothetical protein